MIRRHLWTFLVAGGLVAGGATAAVVTNVAVGSGTALANAGTTLSTAVLSSKTTAGTPGATSSAPSSASPDAGAWGPGDFGGRRGPHGGFGHGLTVTGVSGNTISATGRDGQTITVQVSSTTAYTEAGSSAALSDIHKGSMIAVQGSFASTSTSTSATAINATGVTIVLPQLAGVVTGANGSTLTVTGFDGATHTITVSGSTHYQKAGQSAALSDVDTGTAITAEGALNGDGSLSAVRITIRVPRIGGQVAAVNGSSYTITGRFGSTYTVNTTSSTTFVNADGTPAAASTVKSGVAIMAEGSLSSDGKTLTALRVTIIPADTGFGFGRHGGGDGQPGFGDAGGVGGANGGSLGTAPGGSSSSTSGTSSI